MFLSRLLTGWIAGLLATASLAVVPPEAGPLEEKAFRNPDLYVGSVVRPVSELAGEVAQGLGSELARLGVDPGEAFLDRRTGRWGTLILRQPLIPGEGVGNALRWSDLGVTTPSDDKRREQTAWEAFRSYLVEHAEVLGLDTAELGSPRVVTHGEHLIQIHVGRRYRGLRVRDSYVTAAINSGNLVLLGFRNWGDVELTTAATTSRVQAEEALLAHLEEIPVAGFQRAARLEIVPVSDQPDATQLTPGEGLGYRLVWVLTPKFSNDAGNWEALVDAVSGELLALEDTNQYASRQAVGDIYPVSNDGAPPDGTLQPSYPMPFADILVDGVAIGFTSKGGNAPSEVGTGPFSTTLSGRFVGINDACGAIDESTDSGNLDLAGVDGTDCDAPAGHSAGDTNASRTGFYELNRLIEQARGYLPDNAWLGQQLTANMNINQSCNAFWNGVSVNFYRQQLDGTCGNTGEIAAIFDHEWGHGIDNNDTNPTISSPGESIADIIAQNRLNESCIGRGFHLDGNCGGYGDPCTECTGVRESDWEKRQSGQPHGIDWILDSCSPVGQVGPCGRETHCEGTIVAEAAWDLVHRDLQGFEGSPLNLDLNTALELGTRLSYYGSSNVGGWYQCNPSEGTGDGCNADGGYLGYLAADDDNGDLSDGTPHMSAIHAAFARHQIACDAPVVQDAGCAGGPAAAPANVVATPFHEGVQLTWDEVPGASEYWVYRTEGVHGCDFGKSKVGVTTSTNFIETDLGNDFEVFYGVVAVGENDACTGPMSACVPATPVPGPGLGFAPTPLAGTPQTGDGDDFFDNCETWDLTFQVSNTGVGALTDVRVVSAEIVLHAESFVLTALPATIAGSLAEGAAADGLLEVRGGGFAFDDVLEIEVEITADELAPLTFTRTYTLGSLESDLEPQPSVTFSFEEGDDGWQLVSGVFDRTDAGGGAAGTAFYRASSTNLNLTCDRIRSPLMQLTETSTLELFNQYDIEDMSGGVWWDRANLGLFDPVTDERTIVSPDGGRLYNASGTNDAPAPCASAEPPDAPGWASNGPGWETSSWTADALGAPDLAGQLVQLDVAYGTDPAALGDFGFWFDEVTLTDVQLQVADVQPDACADLPHLSFDPAGLDFGDVLVDRQSVEQVATLTNTGEVAATDLSLTQPGGGFVADTADCGSTLAPAESCAIRVTFTPPAPGPAAATLTASNGEGTSAGLDLTGNGVEDAAVFDPAGLLADPTATAASDGNGVFEPGELVVVAPEWRNDGTIAGGLTGAAAGFTGPAGASYVTTDDAADYGSVGVDAVVDCLSQGGDCYRMAVNDPEARPAQHWDATFEEALSDGTDRTWALHVGRSFSDVPPGNPFYASIEALLHSGVTGGCTSGAEAAGVPAGRRPDLKAGTDGRDGARPLQASGVSYCPGGANSRAQMPVFVLRALEGAEYVPPACTEGAEEFLDVPFGSPFCPWIEELSRRGIVSGCGDGDYCPGDPVTRAQMAIFLLKTLEGSDYTPPPCSETFDDVPCPSLFADWIEDLAAREITGGCSATGYCPGAPVSRAQMATFVTRTFGLTLYGP